MTYKFFCLIFIFSFLFSCDNNQGINSSTDKSVISSDSTTIDNNSQVKNCSLKAITKTADYQANINKIQNISTDTIVILENASVGDKTYKTTLDIKENEIKAWVDIDSKSGQKRILLHQEDYVEYFLTISTSFDLQGCKVIRTTKTFNQETEKTEIKTEDIEL